MKYLRRIKVFFVEFIIRFIANDLFLAANSLSFKLLLAIFPAIITMLTVVGYLHLSYDEIMIGAQKVLPGSMMGMIDSFIRDISSKSSINLFSSALLIAVWSASSGFRALVVGLRRAYNYKVKNYYSDPFKLRGISIMLVFVFLISIVLSLYAFIFKSSINKFLARFPFPDDIRWFIDGSASSLIALFIMIAFIVIANISAVERLVKLKNLIPGTVFTVSMWYVVSMILKFYIDNYTSYSVIYGSIGTLFAMGLWINCISLVILAGGQINALFCDDEFMDRIRNIKK